MTNIVSFRPQRRPRPSEASIVLQQLANAVGQLAETSFETKQELQRAIDLLDISCARTRQFIDLILDEDRRTQLLGHFDRINKMLEVAKSKAAAL